MSRGHKMKLGETRPGAVTTNGRTVGNHKSGAAARARLDG